MKKLLGSLSLLTLGAAMSFSAQAAIHFDSHGNVGYDTLMECQTAVKSGTAKFYKSSTFHKPMLRDGEVAVQTGRLGDLAPKYSQGTCDIGTGRRGGRDGVARAIQGKYIPYSPDMLINQYTDASGNIVRVSMKQCDNWFSAPFPQGMPLDKPVAVPPPEPVVVEPVPVYQPPVVTTPPPAPIPPAPIPPTPISAVSAATGSIPTWVPIAAGVVGVALLISGGSDSDSGTTGTTGTN